jgi:uncharacterized protein YggE
MVGAVALGIFGLGALLFGERPALLFGQPPPKGAGPRAEKEKRTINTSGTATVRVKADSARVFFGVADIAPTIKEARTSNAERVRRMIGALKDLNIPDLRMKTADVQVVILNHQKSEEQLPRVVGYRVQTSLTVLIQDNDPVKLGATAARVLDTALENGANSIQHVTFFRKETNEAQREAMTRAVQDALANARALATGVRGEITDTVTISGTPQYYYDSRQMTTQNTIAFGPAGAEGATTLVAGDLELSCTVNVTCHY